MDRGRSSGLDAASPSLELVVVTGDNLAITALPEKGALTLGRGEECEIRIVHRSVSRRHAVLHMGPVVQLEDLGSSNGTFVQDARSPADSWGAQPLRKLDRETIALGVGERVNLGPIPIMIRRGAGALPEAAEPEPEVVRGPAMLALYDQLTRAAQGTISVLVRGEHGVGERVLARAIHERSPRASGPFLELDCAAQTPALLESELFGHEQNAFTAAGQTRPGLLEAADGGTVFLDNVGALPPPVQVKLLRVLDERKVVRVGGLTPLKLDVRFVAATHRDLEAAIAEGTFRQDLYFRLNGVSLVIPPLRERVSEIAPLAEQFLAAACRALDRAMPLRLSPEALALLERHSWPGNLRELREVLERAAVVADGDVIVPADLPGALNGVARTSSKTLTPPAGMEAITATSMMLTSEAVAERKRILEALEQCGGNQTRAAKLLGVSVRTLANRLDRYNIPRSRIPPK
jgi:two-component system, NtrC family, response regulator AtoC